MHLVPEDVYNWRTKTTQDTRGGHNAYGYLNASISLPLHHTSLDWQTIFNLIFWPSILFQHLFWYLTMGYRGTRSATEAHLEDGSEHKTQSDILNTKWASEGMVTSNLYNLVKVWSHPAGSRTNFLHKHNRAQDVARPHVEWAHNATGGWSPILPYTNNPVQQPLLCERSF